MEQQFGGRRLFVLKIGVGRVCFYTEPHVGGKHQNRLLGGVLRVSV